MHVCMDHSSALFVVYNVRNYQYYSVFTGQYVCCLYYKVNNLRNQNQ